MEISDLIRCYLDRGTLQVRLLGRGTAWFDTGTYDSLLGAAQFAQVLQHRQGLQIACLEEIAFDRGWIRAEHLRKQIAGHGNSSYAAYLKKVLRSAEKRV